MVRPLYSNDDQLNCVPAVCLIHDRDAILMTVDSWICMLFWISNMILWCRVHWWILHQPSTCILDSTSDYICMWRTCRFFTYSKDELVSSLAVRPVIEMQSSTLSVVYWISYTRSLPNRQVRKSRNTCNDGIFVISWCPVNRWVLQHRPSTWIRDSTFWSDFRKNLQVLQVLIWSTTFFPRNIRPVIKMQS